MGQITWSNTMVLETLLFCHVKTSRKPAELVVSEDAAEIILAQVVSEMFNIYKHESFQIL